jgi:hypothetical protein
VSVKDWWVDPRKQVLNVLIACWRYELDKPISLLSTEGGFTPLLQWLSLEWVWTRRSFSHHAMDWVGSPFSQERWLYPLLLTTLRKVMMRWPHEIRMVEGHTLIEHVLLEKGLCWDGWDLNCLASQVNEPFCRAKGMIYKVRLTGGLYHKAHKATCTIRLRGL